MYQTCHSCIGANCGQILEISIYWESNTDPAMRYGKHATMFPGRALLKDIFLEEVSGQHVERWQADVDWNGKSLATVELESGAGSRRHRRGDMLVMGKVFPIFGLPQLIPYKLAYSTPLRYSTPRHIVPP